MVRTTDWVRVTVLVENLTDMLLTDDPGKRITRFGLIDHFRPPHGKVICTENGIAYWIEVGVGDAQTTILFDTGLTGMPMLHNAEALGLDLDAVDTVVISHAHPDHYGGLWALLERRKRKTPVVVHPDAFLKKVFLDDAGEPFLHVNDGFDRELLETAGAMVVEARGPVELAAGVWATGGIPRNETFEPPVPIRTGKAGLFLERDGRLENDDGTIDDQAVVISARSEGLLVLTACGHSGIVNTVRHGQKLTGVDRVAAIMGGFHLGFPGVPQSNIAPTVTALREFAPALVAPMHCSGFEAQMAVARALPSAYVQNVVGTTIAFGS